MRFWVCRVCQEQLIFKQFLQTDSLQVIQIESCRIGGVNELSVILMAKTLRGVRFKCEVTIVKF